MIDIAEKVAIDWWRTSGFSTETRIVLGLMNTDLPNALKYIIDEAIRKLVRNGDWVKLGQLLVVLDTSANSLIDWMGNQNGLAVASPVFTPFTSWGWNGTTQYINCQLIASSVPNTSLDNNEIGAWVVSKSGTGTQTLIGTRVNSSRETILRDASGTIGGKTNSATFTTAAEAIAGGNLYSNFRIDSVNQHLWKNGVELAQSAVASNLEPAQPYFWGSRNNAGTASLFYNGESSLFYVGSGTIDTLFVYNTFNTMITAIAALG